MHDLYRNARCHGRAGFTLVELMIAIGIVAILTAIAVPDIINWLPNYRLKAAARDLYSAATKAKGAAVKRNLNCALTFNQVLGGTTAAYIVYVDSDSDCEYDFGETIITQIQAWPKQISLDLSKGGGDGLTFTNNDDGNPTISFRPIGIPTGNGGGFANGTAFLTNTNGQTRSVVINNVGNVKIK